MRRASILVTVIYLVIMIGTIIAVDFAFLQHHTELRLFGNIFMVVVFLGGYLLLPRKQNK